MGLPFKYKVLGKLLGVDMTFLTSIWNWLDGKKLVIGAIIDLLTSLAAFVPVLATFLGPNGLWLGHVTSALIMVIGLLHKLYKAKYNEEHP